MFDQPVLTLGRGLEVPCQPGINPIAAGLCGDEGAHREKARASRGRGWYGEGKTSGRWVVYRALWKNSNISLC